MAILSTDIQKAIQFLKNGELVAIPTETVYGLAANASNESALISIFEAKGRPRFNPLILHVASIPKAKLLVTDFPPAAEKLAKAFWPGPLTMLLPKQNTVSDIVTAGSDKVAVRIPNHPLTLQVLSALDFPLAAPSANPSGYVSPTTAQHVMDQMGEKISMVLDGGACSVGIESTIIGFEENELILYREGGISQEALTEVTGLPVRKALEQQNPDTPGMLSSHYSPTKRLLMQHPAGFDKSKIALLRYSTPLAGIPLDRQFILSPKASLREAASSVFQALRWLDTLPVDIIFGEYVPDIGIGRAINDRLRRASFRSGIS